MFWIVSFTLCVIVCGAILLYGLASKNEEGFAGGTAVATAIVIFFVWGCGHTFFASFTNIGSGDLGIEYGASGVIEGQVGPGTHLIAPWKSVQVVNVKTQSAIFDHLTAFSKESQDVYGNVQVNYHLSPADVQQLYATVGSNWYNTFIPGAVQQDFKEETVKYFTVDIAPNRAAISRDLLVRLQADLRSHSIYVDNVFVQNIDYSPQFRQAIEAKQVASQRAQQAKLDADRQRNLAAGERDATIIRAEGQARANVLLAHSLSDPVIRYLAIQKLNPNVKVILPSGANLYNLGSVGR